MNELLIGHDSHSSNLQILAHSVGDFGRIDEKHSLVEGHDGIGEKHWVEKNVTAPQVQQIWLAKTIRMMETWDLCQEEVRDGLGQWH